MKVVMNDPLLCIRNGATNLIAVLIEEINFPVMRLYPGTAVDPRSPLIKVVTVGGFSGSAITWAKSRIPSRTIPCCSA
jgi:hypothetical protein